MFALSNIKKKINCRKKLFNEYMVCFDFTIAVIIVSSSTYKNMLNQSILLS